MDAVKIDLKAFTESYYAKVVTGQLKPVLDSLVTLRKMGKWTEIVYLVLPTLNDDDAEFRGLAQWIKANLGPDVPLHFTQFHPEYLLKNLPITPVATLERAKAIADAEGLHYVYIGNVPGHPAQNTYCPKCRKMLVERVGFTASQMLIRKNSLPILPAADSRHLARIVVRMELDVSALFMNSHPEQSELYFAANATLLGIQTDSLRWLATACSPQIARKVSRMAWKCVRIYSARCSSRPFVVTAQSAWPQPKVRQAAVAGSFYPADPKVLSAMIDDLLAKRSSQPPITDPILAVLRRMPVTNTPDPWPLIPTLN